MAATMHNIVKTSFVMGALQAVLGSRRYSANRLSVNGTTRWSRAELVEKLVANGFQGGLRVSSYNPETDGLIWSGTSRAPSYVFQHGFQKPQYAGTEDDMGDNVNAWAQHIKDSITKNQHSYGFHFTTSPKVAGQFGIVHAQKAKFRPEDDCEDEFDDACIVERMEEMQRKFGCPAKGSSVWKK